MTNSEALRAEIMHSGLTLKYIAEKLAITPDSLQKKIDNTIEFKAGEIALLCALLHLSEARRAEIFFVK
jgi:hypothetical protein